MLPLWSSALATISGWPILPFLSLMQNVVPLTMALTSDITERGLRQACCGVKDEDQTMDSQKEHDQNQIQHASEIIWYSTTAGVCVFTYTKIHS